MNHNSTSSDPDVDLTSHFSFALGRARRFYKLFFVLLAVFGSLTMVYAHLASPVYTAVAALTPPKGTLMDANSLLGVNGLSGGLASLSRQFGLGDAGGNDDIFEDYARVLQSYRLAGALARQPRFLALAFPRDYDLGTKHLRLRGGVIAEITDAFKTALGLPLSQTSDQDRIYRFLDDRLSISLPTSSISNISEVSFRFDNQAASQELLDIILAEADSLMRADKQKDIAARIKYLQAQLSKSSLEEQRAAIISILTKQQYTMMVLSADHRYASDVVEPPHAPGKPTWPSALSLLALSLFLSFVFWFAAITILRPDSLLLQIFSNDVKISSALKIARARAKNWSVGQDVLRQNLR